MRFSVVCGHGGWGIWDIDEPHWRNCNAISPLFTTRQQAEGWLAENKTTLESK